MNPKDQEQYIHLPSGKFIMGCSADDHACFGDEKPRHEVAVSAFWIGRTEITQDSFEYVMPGKNRSRFRGDQHKPVENLSWEDADTYCRAVGMRLPTEAEWEYAARAGISTSIYGRLEDIAWYSENSGSQTHPVGQKAANAWGLHDMLGNVWEWVSDWYGPYGSDPVKNPQGSPRGTKRVVRGGSCCGEKKSDTGRSERVSNRFSLAPRKVINAIVGARCAAEVLPKK